MTRTVGPVAWHGRASTGWPRSHVYSSLHRQGPNAASALAPTAPADTCAAALFLGALLPAGVGSGGRPPASPEGGAPGIAGRAVLPIVEDSVCGFADVGAPPWTNCGCGPAAACGGFLASLIR